LLRAQSARFAVAAGDVLVVTVPRSTWWLMLVGFALLWLQIALGGWVSTNYAVLACTEFPSCQGSFWPAMDFRLGFTLWRELGAGHGDANFTFQALTAVHYVHRLSAYLVFAVLLLLVRQLYRAPGMRMHAQWIMVLVLWQLVTGVSNVVLGWPLLAAVSHTGGAAALVVVMTGALFSCRRASRPDLREN
jgi:cytochrome c oxidase assembly protein subunit 15